MYGEVYIEEKREAEEVVGSGAVNARNRRLCIPSFASERSVQIQQAAATQIASMAGGRPSPPTPVSERVFLLSSPPRPRAASKGCRSKTSRNVRISRLGGTGARWLVRACGRKGLVGEGRNRLQVKCRTRLKRTRQRIERRPQYRAKERCATKMKAVGRSESDVSWTPDTVSDPPDLSCKRGACASHRARQYRSRCPPDGSAVKGCPLPAL